MVGEAPGSTAFAGGAGLKTTGFGLVCEGLLAGLLCLGLVDELDQSTLVLEGATLALEVEHVVQVLVDLLGLAVLLEQPAQNTLAAHPLHLGGKARVGGTLPLTNARVAALPLRNILAVHAGTRVDVHGLADHVAVLDKLADVLAGVRHGDLIDLIGVQPDLPLAALQHRGGEALLKTKRHHLC